MILAKESSTPWSYTKLDLFEQKQWRILSFLLLLQLYADTDFVINSMTDFIIRDIRNSMIMLHDDKTKFFVLGDR